MNVSIQDSSALQSLGAVELGAYLHSQGWTETEIIEDRAAYWLKRNDEGEEFEALVPQKASLGDYTLRVAQLLQTLSIVESRSESEIYTDIQNTQTDTIRLRFISSVFDSGTVPLAEATQMIESVRELTLAAACAAVTPRAVYAKRKPQEAMDFLKKVRLGQTERGSFILSLHAAVPPRYRLSEREQTVLDLGDAGLADAERDEPFGRRVTLTLARGLRAALHATLRAQSKGDFAPFEEAVAQGVSANLCDALADLGLETSTQTISIEFQWSPTRALLRPAPRTVELQTDHFIALRDAARQFREIEPLKAYEVYGYVIRLDRKEGELAGQITLSDYSENKPRRVRILLEDADYQTALRANGDGLLVQCAGELTREGVSYLLKNPRSFALME